MKQLTALLLPLYLFLLPACSHDSVEPNVTDQEVLASAPRLIIVTDSIFTRYVKVIPDATARTLTLSADSSSQNDQTVYYYAADGMLTRIVNRFPGAPDQDLTISRQGNRIIFSGMKPQPDTVTVTDLGSGRKQLDIVSRSWSNNTSGATLLGVNNQRLLLNAAGLPERVLDSNLVQNGTVREDARLHYSNNGVDTARVDWQSQWPNYYGFTTYRATRDTRIDTSLLRFVNARHGSDLQWLTGHYFIAPVYQLFSTDIRNYIESDAEFLSGGVPVREQLHDYIYNFNQDYNRQRDLHNVLQYDTHGRITRITQTDAVNTLPVHQIEIRY